MCGQRQGGQQWRTLNASGQAPPSHYLPQGLALGASKEAYGQTDATVQCLSWWSRPLWEIDWPLYHTRGPLDPAPWVGAMAGNRACLQWLMGSVQFLLCADSKQVHEAGRALPATLLEPSGRGFHQLLPPGVSITNMPAHKYTYVPAQRTASQAEKCTVYAAIIFTLQNIPWYAPSAAQAPWGSSRMVARSSNRARAATCSARLKRRRPMVELESWKQGRKSAKVKGGLC